MIRSATLAMLLAAFVFPAAIARSAEAVKVTVVLRGADTNADIEVLLSALRSVKGANVLTTRVEQGFRKFGNRFTTPVEVSVPMVPGDDDANVGALATAVAKAKTRNAEKHPPGVNLILFTDAMLNEASISSLRSSLSKVNGLEVSQPGGLGGNLQEGWCWMQFENAGGAMLKEIEKQALASGIEFRRLKNPTQQ